MRPRINGPRSLIRTTTLLPFLLLITLILLPNGKLRCAAVIAEGFMRSPFAVFECSAYQDALPQVLAPALVIMMSDALAAPRIMDLIVNVPVLRF